MVSVCPKGKVLIYTLSNPITNEVRYIGKTIQHYLNSRLSTHISRNKNKLNHTEAWIKSLLKKNLKPNIEILDIVDVNNWENEEKFYISYFKYLGFNLTNNSEGGDKSNLGSHWKLSEEQKKNNKLTLVRKDKGLALYKANGEFIWDIRNVLDLSQIFNIPYSEVYKAYKNKSLIRRTFYLLKKDDLELKELIKIQKVNYRRIKYTNLITNKSYIFESAVKASIKLKIDNSTISKYAKNRHIYKSTNKFEYE